MNHNFNLKNKNEWTNCVFFSSVFILKLWVSRQLISHSIIKQKLSLIFNNWSNQSLHFNLIRCFIIWLIRNKWSDAVCSEAFITTIRMPLYRLTLINISFVTILSARAKKNLTNFMGMPNYRHMPQLRLNYNIFLARFI